MAAMSWKMNAKEVKFSPSNKSVHDELCDKQKKLTPGANITLDEEGNISATGGGGSDPDAVKYTPQSKTSGEKQQARDNLGLGSAATYNTGATNGAVPVNRGTLTNGEVVIIGNNGLKSTPTLGSNILRFGGDVLQDNLSPLDMGLDGVFGANRFAAFDAEQIVVERSSDGGNNWSTVSGLDIEKLRLFRESKGGSIPVIGSGTMTTSNQIRLTVDTSKNAAGAELGDVYFKWQHLLVNVSTNGAKWGNEHKLRLLIEGMKRSTEGGTLEWETIKDTFVSGWSGWNSIPISESGLLVGGFSSQTQEANRYWYLRFTFSCNELSNGQTSIFAIIAIKGYGNNEWTEKNYLATYGQPYTYDRALKMSFENGLYPKTNEVGNLGESNRRWNSLFVNSLNMKYAGSVLTTQEGDGTLAAKYRLLLNTPGIFPTGNNANALITMNRHDGNYYSQLGFSGNGNIYYRCFNNTAIDDSTAWKRLVFGDETEKKAENAVLVVKNGYLYLISDHDMSSELTDIRIARKGKWTVKKTGTSSNHKKKRGYRCMNGNMTKSTEPYYLLRITAVQEQASGIIFPNGKRMYEYGLYVTNKTSTGSRERLTSGSLLAWFVEKGGNEIYVHNGYKVKMICDANMTADPEYRAVHTVHFGVGIKGGTEILPFDIKVRAYMFKCTAGGYKYRHYDNDTQEMVWLNGDLEDFCDLVV